MTRKRVTQADVAQMAGVSQTAVSQILGNLDRKSNFRPETRERVLQAAQELGYLPNIAARTLRTNRTMAIGIILSYLTDELALRITRGIQEIAYERGYSTFIADTEQDARRERQVLEQFRQREVDGLIFVDSWSDPAEFLEDDRYPPMIFAQLREKIGPRNCVGMDNLRGGYEITRHLLDLGYRQIAHVSGPGDWTSGADRIRGYRNALAEHGIEYDPSLVESGDWEILSGLNATNLLLDRHPNLDAVFAANDLMAAGSIQAIVNRGLRIPEDVACVGYDDRYLTEALLPPLTSFAIPLDQIGQRAACLLVDDLLGKPTKYAASIRLQGRLAIRASCGSKREHLTATHTLPRRTANDNS
jgi:DNA-binding LacI/PurR family transcriptional regulator